MELEYLEEGVLKKQKIELKSPIKVFETTRTQQLMNYLSTTNSEEFKATSITLGSIQEAISWWCPTVIHPLVAQNLMQMGFFHDAQLQSGPAKFSSLLLLLRTNWIEKFIVMFFDRWQGTYTPFADYLYDLMTDDDPISEEKAEAIYTIALMLVRGYTDISREDIGLLALVVNDLKEGMDKLKPATPENKNNKMYDLEGKVVNYQPVMKAIQDKIVVAVLDEYKFGRTTMAPPSSSTAAGSSSVKEAKAKKAGTPFSRSTATVEDKTIRTELTNLFSTEPLESSSGLSSLSGYFIKNERGELVELTDAEVSLYYEAKLLEFTNKYKFVGFDPEVIREHYVKVFGSDPLMLIQVISAYISMGANFEMRSSKSNDMKEAQKFSQILKSKGVATNKASLATGKHLTLPRIAGSYPFITLKLRMLLHERKQLPSSGIKTDVNPIYQDMALASLSEVFDNKDFLKKMARQLNLANTMRVNAELLSVKKNEDKERLMTLILKDDVAEERAEQYRQLSTNGITKDPCFAKWGKDSKDKTILELCKAYSLG